MGVIMAVIAMAFSRLMHQRSRGKFQSEYRARRRLRVVQVDARAVGAGWSGRFQGPGPCLRCCGWW